MKITVLSLLVCLFAWSSCVNSSASDEPPNSTGLDSVSFKPISVKLHEVKYGKFDLEIISNGKVFAAENASIKFPSNQEIAKILVKNGDQVRKGQLLAVLDNTESRSRLNRAKNTLEKAFVDLDDRLIDYGYRLKDSLKIPKEIMRMARIKSGYNTALYELDDASDNLTKARIVAPFSGTIADLEARPYNHSNDYKQFCRLINDLTVIVQFPILESEIGFLSKNTRLEVIPLGRERSMEGIVTELNPLIDNDGMVRVRGIVRNNSKDLMEGMNVKVIVKRNLGDQLYVPKEALVQRQNRYVVFTFVDNQAIWNYVETGIENSKNISIRSGLQKGQKIIVSNTLNLAHQSSVVAESTVSD